MPTEKVRRARFRFSPGVFAGLPQTPPQIAGGGCKGRPMYLLISAGNVFWGGSGRTSRLPGYHTAREASLYLGQG